MVETCSSAVDNNSSTLKKRTPFYCDRDYVSTFSTGFVLCSMFTNGKSIQFVPFVGCCMHKFNQHDQSNRSHTQTDFALGNIVLILLVKRNWRELWSGECECRELKQEQEEDRERERGLE